MELSEWEQKLGKAVEKAGAVAWITSILRPWMIAQEEINKATAQALQALESAQQQAQETPPSSQATTLTEAIRPGGSTSFETWRLAKVGRRGDSLTTTVIFPDSSSIVAAGALLS